MNARPTRLVRPSRRQFLKAATALSAAAVAPTVVPASVFGANAPSNRIHVGFIGCGNQSTIDLPAFLGQDDAQVVAVCDVNTASHGYRRPTSSSAASRARTRSTPTMRQEDRLGPYKGCDAYNDFREVLGRKDIDAVAIIVPDHWHGLMTVDGGQGRQGHLLREAAVADRRARARRWSRPCASTSGSCRPAATTAPARPTASPASWCATAGSARSSGSSRRWPRTTPSSPGPGLEADARARGLRLRRCGSAPPPRLPTTTDRCLYRFRFILDYSGGQTTNFGATRNDIAQWGLGMDGTGPVEFEDLGSEWPPKGSLYTTATKVAFRATYANGVELVCQTAKPGFGTRFEGTEGWVEFGYQRPEDLARVARRPRRSAPTRSTCP